MFKQAQKVIAGVAVLAAVAVGAAAVAGAASNNSSSNNSGNGSSSSPQTQRQQGVPPGGHGPGETLLTDGTATKVKKAAEDKVSGGKVLRVETDSDGSPYEAHVQKSDGSQAVVKVNKDFKVTDVQKFPGRGDGPPGAGSGGSGTGYPAGPPSTYAY